MLRKNGIGIAAGVGLVLSAGAAYAQDAVETIIVTAQKRAQSMQDVPVSLEVISGDKLAASQVSSLQNIESLSPSIVFKGHYHPGAFQISIRGIGTQVSADGGYIQQSVVVNLDGVPQSRAAGFWGELVDVERVEVLRGPQGTLFGKNATAGVLNITTKDPSETFGALARVSVADDSGVLVAGTVTGPIADHVEGRLTGWYKTNNGWGKNYFGGNNVGYTRSSGVRGKLKVEINEDVDLLLTASYGHIHTNGQWFLGGAVNTGLPGGKQAQAIAPVIATPTNNTVNVNSDPYSFTTNMNASAQLNWKLSSNTELVSISSFSSNRVKYQTDVDQTPLPYTVASLQIFSLNYDPDSPTWQNSREFTEEFRLQGTYGALNWTTGFFYSNYYEKFTTRQHSLSALGPVRRYRDASFTNGTPSVFADLQYDVTDQLSVIGGIRHTWEFFDYDYFRDTSREGGPATVFGPFSGPVEDTGLSARAGLQWKMSPDVNFYGMWSQGYKGPALDLSDQRTDPLKPVVGAEQARSIELGMKSMLFDDTLRLNVSLFRTTVEGFQAFKIIPPIGTKLVSAGDVESQGIELEADWKVSDSFDANLGLVYDDGHYVGTVFDCFTGQTAAQGCSIDLDGNGIPESQDLNGKPLAELPKLKINVSGRYQQEIMSGWMAYIQPTYTWQDATQFQINQDPRTIRKPIGILDISAGVRNDEMGWDLMFFVKNATAEFYPSYIGYVAAIGGEYHQLPREYRRYIGLQLTAKFGGE